VLNTSTERIGFGGTALQAMQKQRLLQFGNDSKMEEEDLKNLSYGGGNRFKENISE
jgi:hypothetical protein